MKLALYNFTSEGFLFSYLNPYGRLVIVFMFMQTICIRSFECLAL
jgi:hypothetical protein